MDWAQTRFEPAFVGVFWGHYRTPEPLRDLAAIEKNLNDCHFCLQKIDDQLADKDYLVDDKLTLADISLGVFLHRLTNIDLEICLPSRVDSWHQRLEKSAGFRQWVMSDFSGLKGRLQY